MTDENYQGVGDNGVGGSLGTGDSWTAAMLTEIEKRIDDELKKFKAGIQGDGVVSGLAVSQKGAGANQSVDVASGSCTIGSTVYTEGGTVNVALDAAHGTYARWDIITYDASAGDPSKVTGTAGAIPTIPDVPSGDIILALVLRAANDNVVSNAEITDKRIVIADFMLKDNWAEYQSGCYFTTVSTTTVFMECCLEVRKAATYTIRGAIKSGWSGQYAKLYYRINEGSWVLVGTNTTTSYVGVQTTGVSLSANDRIDFGLKCENASYAAQGKACKVIRE